MIERLRKARIVSFSGVATRYWAVYVDGELLAVVLYRKGAEAVADRLMDLAQPPPWSGRVAERSSDSS